MNRHFARKQTHVFRPKMDRISNTLLIIFIFANPAIISLAQNIAECPQDWFSSSDHCYHFVIYPTLPFDEASQACHQDGGSLLSINTADENTFIATLLLSVDVSRSNQWYTSGQDRNGQRLWTGDGSSIASDNSYWAVDPNTEAQLAHSLVDAQLVYMFSEAANVYGWSWTRRTNSLPYICETSLSDVYRINQRDRDFSFGQTSTDPNDWPVGPHFTYVSPNIVFTTDTQQLIIDCVADGNPAPIYEWYKDFGTPQQQRISATEYSVVTNGRLVITRPTRERDPGTYTCVANNTVGSSLGNPVFVAAGYVGEFSNDRPGARTAVLYQGALIDCSPPRYNPALLFQWIKDDHFIRPEMNPHTYLSENGNLYFSEVQAADAANYKCIITLTPGPGQTLATDQPQYRMSLPIPLNIRGENANEFGPDIHDDFPAVFPQQPLAGLEMRIECLAYGRLPLHYSWSRVDGQKMPAERITFSSLNRVLHIRQVRIEDSGTYMCSVSGPVNRHSKNITINVAASPYFMFPLRNQHLDVGSRLSWVCDAVAIPAASYLWYKNGQELHSDQAQNITVAGNVLTITRADAAKHDGMYQCKATNDHGTQISSAQIRVLSFKPNFDKKPMEHTLMATVGGNLTIHCQPEGAPQPTITWMHNRAPIAPSAGRVQILQNGNLVLSGLSPADAGEYTCTAENTLGSASSSGRLTVLSETTISRKPLSTVVSQNSTASIPCQASYTVNKTDLVYVWYFNGFPIDFTRDVSYVVAETGGLTSLYVIAAQFKHEGMYECRATTVYDSASASAYLTVLGPPDEPAGVHVHSNTASGVTLWWQPGRIRGEPVTYYRIDYSNNYNDTWITLESGVLASETQISEYPEWRQYVIPASRLSPGVLYQFRVAAASSSFGYGLHSMPSELIKVDDAPPNHAVQFVSGGGGSVGMLRIKWLPLPLDQHGGIGVYYRAYWRQHRYQDDQWSSSKDPILGNNPDRDGIVYHEEKVGAENFYTEYDVKVQVWNSLGPGPNSTLVTIFSAEDIPVITPQNVHAEAINSTAAIIYWDMPNNTRDAVRGKVWGYQINWYPWGNEREREFIRFIRYYSQETRGIIIGLAVPNGDYWVDVQVFNTAGFSSPSGRATVTANYNAPLHYPEYVTVLSNGPDSVRVLWRGVSTVQIEAPVWGYTIWYWPYTDDIRTAKKAVFGKQFSGVISGLEKDMIYKLRVMGTSNGGEGRKSPATYFTLGGEVRFDPQTSEIMAAAAYSRCNAVLILCLLALVFFSHKMV